QTEPADDDDEGAGGKGPPPRGGPLRTLIGCLVGGLGGGIVPRLSAGGGLARVRLTLLGRGGLARLVARGGGFLHGLRRGGRLLRVVIDLPVILRGLVGEREGPADRVSIRTDHLEGDGVVTRLHRVLVGLL